MIYRIGVILVAVAAGVAVGGLVFKVVGEESVGSQVRVLSAKLGFGQPRPGDTSALDILERVAPGTSAGFKSAAIGTVLAATIAATAVTITIREVAS